MTAAAQPTPLLTERTPAGQFTMQAPHSIHRSASRMTAFLDSTEKIRWGQTTAHMPQPVQAAASNFKVDTFRMY
jgi:hypothetical protein